MDIVGDYPQLQTTVQGALTLLGTLNTLSLSAYGVTTNALNRDAFRWRPSATSERTHANAA